MATIFYSLHVNMSKGFHLPFLNIYFEADLVPVKLGQVCHTYCKFLKRT